MPILDSSFDTHVIDGSGYDFSATRLDQLDATEYTLVCIAADVSSSVGSFRAEIESCVKEVVRACGHSPRADNLMLRLTRFNHRIEEVHGYRPLTECNPIDYDGALPCSGCTALYDASHNAVESVARYGHDLQDAGLTANGIVFVITDGEDNQSTQSVVAIRDALTKARSAEHLESVLTILVGVGTDNQDLGTVLSDLANDAGFDHFLGLPAADAKTLASLADFVSRHIALQSRVLGTGAAARALSLSF